MHRIISLRLAVCSVLLAATVLAVLILQTTPAEAVEPERSAPLEAIAKNLRPIFGEGDIVPGYKLTDRMERYGVSGVAIAVLRDGKVAYAGGFGVLQAGSDDPVDENTLFSVGSVSKVAAAAMVLKLQANGILDIDQDVREYLKSWQMPASPENTPVTLRMLLSHTAGFNLHGFGDFAPGAALPSVYDTLNGTAPAMHERLRFLSTPGERFRYSGGGYTLAQLIMTDVTQQDFPTLARKTLFEPLGMARSSFENPLPEDTENVAKAHNRQGRPVALPRGYEAMPEMAASGLWTSAAELGQFVVALIESHRMPGGYLPQSIAGDMMTRVDPSEHGVGPRIMPIGENWRFQHSGANDSYRAWIEGHFVTGNGLVVLTNGTRGHELYREIRDAAADVFDW